MLTVAEDVALQAKLAGASVKAMIDLAYRNEVEPAEDKDNDARSDHDTPERQTKLFLSTGWFVEISHHVDAEYDHSQSERHKTMTRTQQWPVALKVRSEKGELGSDKKHWRMSAFCWLYAIWFWTYCS